MAVDDVSVTVEPGQFFTLLGPSGCGKTTTLRSIAGLESPDEGEIRVGETVVFSSSDKVNVEAHRRGLGMVFQSYAIWPHMTVERNVSFPLTVGRQFRDLTDGEIRDRVERALDTVQLGELIDRPATDLSGGQQQRLALARALVHEPSLLLLDEPLSNLDASLRKDMRTRLRNLQRDLGVTTIYVTHDQAEALSMSNTIAVMRQGRIEQLARPGEIYLRPSSRFVADFIGSTNFVDGRVVSREGDEYRVESEVGEIVADAASDFEDGEKVVVSIRPESLRLLDPADDAGIANGAVKTRLFLGAMVDHVVSVGGTELLVRSHPADSRAEGTRVGVQIPDDACSIVPRD